MVRRGAIVGGTRLEETKRLARVLRIVYLISVRPRTWTRRRLAAEFEISDRMIDKDLQLIRHGLRHAPNGYYLVNGPPVKPLELTIPEALALVLGAQQASDTGTVDAAVIASALTRLERALPEAIVPYMRRAAESGRTHLFGPVQEHGATLATLRQAMAEGRKVAITYSTASRDGETSERVLAPYYLQPYERSWQVIADDDQRGAVRMFKLDRIQECELTEERYTVPDDFDPVAYVGTSWGVLRGEASAPEDVSVRFTPLAGRWVRDDRWHVSQCMEELPDGGIRLRFHCGVTHELARWVLSYGGEVVVEEPESLRAAVVEEARRVLMQGTNGSDVAMSGGDGEEVGG